MYCRVTVVFILGQSPGTKWGACTRYSGFVASTSSAFSPRSLLTHHYLKANTAGVYAHATYNNRGILRTSPTSGAFEILTVPPGPYGPKNFARSGHVHVIISAEGYESLVTQFYVCKENDGKAMESDLWVSLLLPFVPSLVLDKTTDIEFVLREV